jgi:glycosyltransferase involved in cell wall biosynthesis
MKIGLDISQSVYEGSGVARYMNGLLESILANDFQNNWTFFFGAWQKSLPSALKDKIRARSFKLKQYPFPPKVLSFLWNRLHILNLENFVGKLDWFISSDWTEPPTRNIRKATVVHDLVYLKYPETVHWSILKTQNMRLSRVVVESEIIFADSQATKKDLMELLNVAEAKIEVVYPGVKVFKSLKPVTDAVLRKYALSKKKYILTVGKREPRKNLENLFVAFEKAALKDTVLVVVGAHGWGENSKKDLKNVRFVGHVSDGELEILYREALFFVYPSLYEGFGFPLVEAFNYEVPTCVSNTSSLAEIGAGASLFFDPQNIDDMATEMTQLFEDKELRKSLVQKGLERAAEFTWEKTLVKMVERIEKGSK